MEGNPPCDCLTYRHKGRTAPMFRSSLQGEGNLFYAVTAPIACPEVLEVIGRLEYRNSMARDGQMEASKCRKGQWWRHQVKIGKVKGLFVLEEKCWARRQSGSGANRVCGQGAVCKS